MNKKAQNTQARKVNTAGRKTRTKKAAAKASTAKVEETTTTTTQVVTNKVMKNNHKNRATLTEQKIDGMIFHPFGRSLELTELQGLSTTEMSKTKKAKEMFIAANGFAFKIVTDAKKRFYERTTTTGTTVYGEVKRVLDAGYEVVAPNKAKNTTIRRKSDGQEFVGALLSSAQNGVTSIIAEEGFVVTGEPQANAHNAHQVGSVISGG